MKILLLLLLLTVRGYAQLAPPGGTYWLGYEDDTNGLNFCVNCDPLKYSATVRQAGIYLNTPPPWSAFHNWEPVPVYEPTVIDSNRLYCTISYSVDDSYIYITAVSCNVAYPVSLFYNTELTTTNWVRLDTEMPESDGTFLFGISTSVYYTVTHPVIHVTAHYPLVERPNCYYRVYQPVPAPPVRTNPIQALLLQKKRLSTVSPRQLADLMSCSPPVFF